MDNCANLTDYDNNAIVGLVPNEDVTRSSMGDESTDSKNVPTLPPTVSLDTVSASSSAVIGSGSKFSAQCCDTESARLVMNHSTHIDDLVPLLRRLVNAPCLRGLVKTVTPGAIR